MNEVINDSDEYLRVGSGFPSHESSNDKETTQSKIDQIQYSKCSVFNKIILKAKKKLFADIIFLDYAFLSAFFICYLTVNFGTLSRFEPKFTRSLVMRLGSKYQPSA